jgi:predicted porin
LSQSNVGLQVKEPLGAGWSVIGQLESGFDPYSLNFASGPGAMHQNIGLPLQDQSSGGDAAPTASSTTRWVTSASATTPWGTLTFFRQLSLGGDAIRAYDPMGGSYAFSVIGYSGAAAGGGYTENKVGTTSIK